MDAVDRDAGAGNGRRTVVAAGARFPGCHLRAKLPGRGSGSRSRIVHRAIPVDDPARRCPDITLARSAPGWQPRVSLDAGLKRTIAWFDRMLARFGRPPREASNATA